MEVKYTENNEDDQMLELYKAAKSGSVATLTALLQNDSLILNKVSLTSFTETPLHLSALAGHLDFTITLLNEKPEFASQLDSLNRSPLHLASAEGHEQVVQALLDANPDACLVFDDEGNIPLHLAIIRGHVGVIQKLIRMKPDSIKELVNGDQTVFHLAVRRNQLKALQELRKWDDELFVSPDHQGNTILHVASMLKHVQIIKYLISISSIKASINSLNAEGFTALDLVKQCPVQDFRSRQVKDILIKAETEPVAEQDLVVSNTAELEGTRPSPQLSLILNYWKQKIIFVLRKCDKYLKHRQNWIQEMQGTLMLVATVTATISYQSATTPPGGVWGQDVMSDISNSRCNDTTRGIDKCEAGYAVLAYEWAYDYLFFISCITVTFVASLSVILLIVSGAPLHNKFCTWLLTVAMVVAVMFLSLAFLRSLILVTPWHIFGNVMQMYNDSINIWVGLFGFVGLVATIRLLRWLVLYRAQKLRSRQTNAVGPMTA
ncbi:hypothetical protein COLO4_30802 [Corchorus olitorius]|uniref:PGG domain-containing protein n=1 Tax=Corchorus olitorius TaxID=93759 RepID=A0A1R3H6S4_9ROSI|nr:hypothetical protein COLO4_30802 [Corchorus olitorius]